IVLSNELPDAFSVHKVILQPDGSAEVSFVAPWLSRASWNTIEKAVPATVRDLVTADSQAIRAQIFSGKRNDEIYLSRAALNGLLGAMTSWPDYAVKVELLRFHEIYLPAGAIPELAVHLHEYAQEYRRELAKSKNGLVTYINLGESNFIQGAGQILSA